MEPRDNVSAHANPLELPNASAPRDAARAGGWAWAQPNGRGRWLVGAWLAGAAGCLCGDDARAQGASPFRLERFDEDWNGNARESPFGAGFKNLPVANRLTFSVGGDARWRLIMLDAPRLGLDGAQPDTWFLQRLLFHGDLHYDDRARLFLQLGAHHGVGRQIPSPTDDGGIDLQQAFVDLSAGIAGGRATLRLGRQELVLGPRFVAARDSGNTRQRHDLARLSYVRGALRADAFVGHPVTVEAGAFDDRPDRDQHFYGMRLARRVGTIGLEGYIYGLDRDRASLAGLSARDDRVSFGLRATGRRGDLDFDAELVLQRGRFGSQNIRATGAVIDFGRRWPNAPLAPRLGARFTYGSGDADAGDAIQGTFAPPFPNTAWFGPSGLASFSNMIEGATTLSLDARPGSNFNFNFKLGALWRADPADFVYAGGAALAGTRSGEAYVGAAGNLLVLWFISRNLVLAPGLSYLRIGDGLRARGARDLALTQFIVNFQF